MSELTLTLLRLGFLALLWIFVFSIVVVLRRDLFGTQIMRRATPVAGPARGRRSPPAAPRTAAVVTVSPRLPGAPRSLVVTDGALKGTTVALGDVTILIGRAPECTLVLDDDYVSGRHARFFTQQGVWMVEDLGSTNGTYLGRARLEAPAAVEPGMPVRIGRTILELRR